MKFISVFLLSVFIASVSVSAQSSKDGYFELRVYNTVSEDQGSSLDQYLQNALLPALHRSGIKKVGVFKTNGDTSSIHKLYVIIPFRSLTDFENIESKLMKDSKYVADGGDYINASYDKAPYLRMEKIILKSFPGLAELQEPKLTAAKKDRIYELRSYEGPTEKYYHTKVKMFITGDEIGLFKRLNFNPVFYSEVIAGKSMPNLMYMTTFEDMADRDAHWKSFGDDPQWKKLIADKQYDHTVSHSDIIFLHPAEYSDL
jgi:hypothetical protein